MSLSAFAQGSVRFLADDYKYAIDKAKKESKLVFVDTYASWCKPCKKQEPVFRDQSLAQFFNDHFVNVKVNMDNELGKSLALKYGVVFLPTLMILDDHGNVRYRSDQSFSADLLTADELLKIAIGTVYPQDKIATAPTPQTTTAAVSPPVKSTPTPAPTQAQPRHVQHTDLSKHKQRNDDVARSPSTVSNENNPAKAKASSSDITPIAGEKILYVLGEGDDLPPEVLREEAYFRLSLMDGSHRDAVKKYLRTQQDWAKEENMKFLFDFLYTTRSDEFTYLIYNRHKYEKLIGKEKVANTIKILVNQTLERAFPRPDQKEAQALYSYINPATSRRMGTKYNLEKLYDDKEIDKFIPLAKDYLEDMDPSDADMMFLLANTISANVEDKKMLKYAMKLVDKSIKIKGSKFEYLDTKAFLYYKLGNKKKASETAQIGIALAKSRGIRYESTLELLKLIENL